MVVDIGDPEIDDAFTDDPNLSELSAVELALLKEVEVEVPDETIPPLRPERRGCRSKPTRGRKSKRKVKNGQKRRKKPAHKKETT